MLIWNNDKEKVKKDPKYLIKHGIKQWQNYARCTNLETKKRCACSHFKNKEKM